MARFTVHDGEHRRIVDVTADTVRIGRDPDCDIYLPGDVTVSRVHAVLRRTPGGWQAVDQGSRNGTYVNGAKLQAPRMLADDDRIGVGGFVVLPQADDDRDIATAAATQHRTSAQVQAGLSGREVEVLRLVAGGLRDDEIAAHLVIGVSTVRSHLDRIRDKTGARRRPDLLRWAYEHGIA